MPGVFSDLGAHQEQRRAVSQQQQAADTRVARHTRGEERQRRILVAFDFNGAGQPAAAFNQQCRHTRRSSLRRSWFVVQGSELACIVHRSSFIIETYPGT